MVALHAENGDWFVRSTLRPAPLLHLFEVHANFFAYEHPLRKDIWVTTSSFWVHNRAPIELHFASAASNVTSGKHVSRPFLAGSLLDPQTAVFLCFFQPSSAHVLRGFLPSPPASADVDRCGYALARNRTTIQVKEVVISCVLLFACGGDCIGIGGGDVSLPTIRGTVVYFVIGNSGFFSGKPPSVAKPR